jgi:hypothetical protein
MRPRSPQKNRVAGGKTNLSAAKLDALIEQTLVEVYGDSEQRTAFYAVLEDSLALPFTTQVFGMEVIVERLDFTADEQIIAVCCRGRTRQRIPILDLPLPAPPPVGTEWIAAYRRWAKGTTEGTTIT